MKRTEKSTRGFTLVELLVAMTIIMILTVVAMVNYGSAQKNARDAKRKSDLEKARIGLEMYKQDHDGCYPTYSCGLQMNALGVCTWGPGGLDKSHSYLDKVPTADPLGWQYVYAPWGACGTEGDATGYSLASFMELEKNMTNIAGVDAPPCNAPGCPGPSYKVHYIITNP